MGIVTGKVKLTALKHIIQKRKNKEGKDIDCILIPIAANHLYYNADKQIVSLDIIAFDSLKPEFKQTHSMKQSFSKEELERQKAAEEQTPFLGSLNTDFGGASAPASGNAAPGVVVGDDDDVPF